MKLVVHNGSNVWGGNEKWMANVAAGLQDRGHEVIVSCKRGVVGQRLHERGIGTTGVRPGGDLDLARAYIFLRWLRRQRPAALLATSWNRIPALAWAARRAGVPRFVVRLGIVRDLPRRGLHARAFRDVPRMIVNAEEIRTEWLRSAPWFPAEAVRVIHNGIDPAPAPPPDFRAAFRREIGVADDARLIVGVGHVFRRKGFDVLLDAFADLADASTHLVIVGSGAEEAELRRQAERLRVAARVHWAGFRADVPAILAACDVFVLSSRNEGMANVMLEAMDAGVPVVATKVSGVPAALDAGENAPPAGWIVPVDDAGAMARAIREVFDADPAERRRRVEEARRRTRSLFSMERMVDEVEHVLFGGQS